MLHDALEASDPEWNLGVKAMSHLSMHPEAKVVVDCQFDRAAKAHNDLQTSQGALEKCCNVDLNSVLKSAAGTHFHGTASQYEHVERLVR